VRDQICEHRNMAFTDYRQTIDEELKFLNIQIMNILCTPKLQLLEMLSLLLLLMSSEQIVEETEVSHHLE